MSACVQPISCEAQRHSQACRGLTTAAGHRQLSSIADSPLSEVTGCTQPEADQLRSGSAPQRLRPVAAPALTHSLGSIAVIRPVTIVLDGEPLSAIFPTLQLPFPVGCSPS